MKYEITLIDNLGNLSGLFETDSEGLIEFLESSFARETSDKIKLSFSNQRKEQI